MSQQTYQQGVKDAQKGTGRRDPNSFKTAKDHKEYDAGVAHGEKLKAKGGK